MEFSEIQAFPKAELHCHLDGSIRPATLMEIAKVQNMAIPQDLAVVKEAMTAPADAKDLVDYLAPFDFVAPYLQTEIALEMAAFDVMEQAFEDGIVYIEIRFAPSLSQEKGLTVSQTILAVARGIAKGEEKYPIDGNILVIGMRQEKQEEIKKVFQETQQLENPKVVGLDLAGPELDDSVTDLSETYRLVIDETSLSLTLHAGECGCIANVVDSVDHGAQRVGHGIAIATDEAVQEKLIAANVCIEGCPTSNLQTKAIEKISDYPIRNWLAKGVQFCLNTDNKTVSDTTLSKEYDLVMKTFDLDFTDFYQMNQVAINAAFASSVIRSKVQTKMQAASQKYL